MTVKDVMTIIGLVVAIGGPAIGYGRLAERQEKNDITLAEHGRKIEFFMSDRVLLERIHQLELRISEMTTQLKEFRDETNRKRR